MTQAGALLLFASVACVTIAPPVQADGWTGISTERGATIYRR